MEKLKLLREKNNFTQTEIAKKLNINNVTYGRYESNAREPDIATLCKIADYYGVSLDYLCDHKTTNIIDLSQKSESFKMFFKQIENFDDNKIILLTGYAIRLAQE